MQTDSFAASLEKLITERHAVRAFLPRPVARETLEHILRLAARSPSGANLQPWKVHVVEGNAKQRLEQRMLAMLDDPKQRAAPAALREPASNRPRTCRYLHSVCSMSTSNISPGDIHDHPLRKVRFDR
ncbi:nitroreductase family protein [Variovorax sp. Root411]|uniref:nitroreductase family protein n=1 Tax=Variovorax sp. Root411 TaxID=1736530 RepID=UPI00138F62F8|nr:nitroreductase family protein [Variovorax sp. Root411]